MSSGARVATFLTRSFTSTLKTTCKPSSAMKFCLAILLIEGKAGLRRIHTYAVVNRPDVQARSYRIHFGVDPDRTAGYDKCHESKITCKMGE